MRYDAVSHGAMIGDRGRTDAYARAIERHVKPGARVLDIGTGTGIFALIACRAGAAHVYAVEADDIVDVARAVARANGVADRVTFIQARSTDVELPQRVDGVVAEIHGALPMYKTSLHSLLDARERLLESGGWMVPRRETLWGAIVASPSIERLFFANWKTAYGFNLSAAQTRAINNTRQHPVTAEQLLVEPQCWATLDYATLQSPNVAGELSWTFERAAIGHGVSLWFDCETAEGIGFSNSPMSGEDHAFGNVLAPWPKPTPLDPGDRVHVRLRADFHVHDYVWTWDTRIIDADGATRQHYRQSSFIGAALPDARRD